MQRLARKPLVSAESFLLGYCDCPPPHIELSQTCVIRLFVSIFYSNWSTMKKIGINIPFGVFYDGWLELNKIIRGMIQHSDILFTVG